MKAGGFENKQDALFIKETIDELKIHKVHDKWLLRVEIKKAEW